VTGHPDRASQELVFVADLTVELRAWPTDTWANLGVDPQAAVGAVVAAWRGGGGRPAPDGPGWRAGRGGSGGVGSPAALTKSSTSKRARGRTTQGHRPHQPVSGRRPGERFL
jgi:hypothetical protein